MSAHSSRNTRKYFFKTYYFFLKRSNLLKFIPTWLSVMYVNHRKMGNQSSHEAHAENWQLKEENSKLEEQIKELQVSTSYKLMSLKKLLEEIASRFWIDDYGTERCSMRCIFNNKSVNSNVHTEELQFVHVSLSNSTNSTKKLGERDWPFTTNSRTGRERSAFSSPKFVIFLIRG